jgi:hypothetical protein
MALSDVYRTYRPTNYPQIDSDTRLFLTREFNKLQDTLQTAQQILKLLDTTKTPLVNAINDAAASAAGVPIHGLYHNNGAVRVRLT